MKRIALVLAFISSTALGNQMNSIQRLKECAKRTSLCNVEYSSTYDGDTFTVDVPYVNPLFGSLLRVRLGGVDTPEFRTKNECEKRLSIEARDFLEARVSKSRFLDLFNCKKDKYFRVVCDVFHDKKSISALILEAKLGVPYDGGTKPKVDWCVFEKNRKG